MKKIIKITAIVTITISVLLLIVSILNFTVGNESEIAIAPLFLIASLSGGITGILLLGIWDIIRISEQIRDK